MTSCVHFQGLSHFRLESIEHCTHLARHSSSVLRCFMNVVGQDFDSAVNFHALHGLAKVVGSLPDEVVVANLSEIVSKIYPFFDNSRRPIDSTAAMACLESVSRFVCKCPLADFKEVFRDLVNTDVVVSLLLHVNDDDASKRDAATNATISVLETFDDERLTNIAWSFKFGNLDYAEFLRQLSQTRNPKLQDFNAFHISRCISYFKFTDPRIRSNAVVFLTSLLLESHEFDDAKSVCVALSKLLSDSSTEVQKTAASNLGKVLVSFFAQFFNIAVFQVARLGLLGH